MLQNVLKTNIEAKLNANTTALVSSPTNNVYFVLGQYFHDDSENADFIYQIENGYKTIDATYVPCSMRFKADYTPLFGTKTGSAVIDVDFFICADDVDFNARLSALDEVVALIVGNSESVTDGSTVYKTVWNMTAFTDLGKVFIFNGKHYIGLNTTIFVDFSDTYHYGNEWSLKLDATTLGFLSAKSERGGEEDLPPRKLSL